MKCVLFTDPDKSGMVKNFFDSAKIQSGIDLTAYVMIQDEASGDGYSLYRLHHYANRPDIKDTFEKVMTDIKISADSFDKFYIFGFLFHLRDQFLNKGVDYKKISMCYGDFLTCHSPLDEIFIINKKPPEIPFKKVPAEIYRQYEGETFRAHNRRLREGFFDKYCHGEGLDVGYGGDVIVPNCAGWDFQNGDAQYLAGIDDESFDFVYSSHCLEHMYDVRISLQNWFRVVRKGGYLLLAIPHRDLYEKKTTLPSRWNLDHKHMFLIGKSEPPDTLDIVEEIRAALTNYDIKYIKACDEGHTITDPLRHSDGEYQIEVVIQKR